MLRYKKMLAAVGKLKVSQEKSVGQCHLMPAPTKWLGLSSLPDMNTSDIIQQVSTCEIKGKEL